MPNFPLRKKRKSTENDITPIPPSCINAKRIIFPISENLVAVSTTVNPVTQVAEVAVKRESINEISLPLNEKGCIKRIAPVIITAKNENTKNACGLNLWVNLSYKSTNFSIKF